MSWSPLLPVLRSRKDVPVAVGCSAGGTRQQPGLRIVLRADALDGADFLTAGHRVDVLRGGGEHAGMLRIVPGRSFLLFSPRPEKSRTVLLRGVPLLPGIRAEDRPAVAVEFDHGAEWVEITLPDWARLGGAPAPAPAGPAKAPYSISERVADPAAALRGARR